MRKRKIREPNLALAGEAVHLLEASAGHATLQDAKVLFRVYIERFVVNGLIVWDIGCEMWVEEGIVVVVLGVAVEAELIGGRIQLHR
jgi:hypothetical protein